MNFFQKRTGLKSNKILIMKTIILTLIFFITVLMGCNNNDDNKFIPTLPPATQTGANTFGCYIDGKLLVPRDGTGYYGGSDDGMSSPVSGTPPNWVYKDIHVHDFKSSSNGIMDIHFVNLHENGEGIFEIQESNCERGLAANATLNIRCRINEKWYCSIENTGTLTITRYDYENRIFSGTFSCKAVNRDNPDDIVDITQGRFDIKWDTLSTIDFP